MSDALEQKLAAAVIRQAVRDLREMNVTACDAADFLLVRLWEPENLWRELFGDAKCRARIRGLIAPVVAMLQTRPCGFRDMRACPVHARRAA